MKFWRKRKTVQPPTLVVQHDALSEALDALAGVFGDGMTADGTGSTFTCTEADTIARVLVLAGHSGAAETWLEGHASGDDGGDDHWHYEGDDDEGHAFTEDEVAAYVKEYLA
ncbi:hypothetical protein [Streptomyces sp. NPDC046805]|uniref:hypothetical protein n=1 Tax=Streptomyces sp. NPDC046805 TaxID=3155134 RepID=UPI00340ECE76